MQSLLNAKNVNLISQTELIAEELRLAINEIGRLTGAVGCRRIFGSYF